MVALHAHSGQALGDDSSSWALELAFDSATHGIHLRHDNKSRPLPLLSARRCREGDVVGCALDLNSTPNRLRFFINGQDVGTPVTGIDVGTGLTPACSIASAENAAQVRNSAPSHFASFS